jgi:hypothetical protein
MKYRRHLHYSKVIEVTDMREQIVYDSENRPYDAWVIVQKVKLKKGLGHDPIDVVTRIDRRFLVIQPDIDWYVKWRMAFDLHSAVK